MPLFSYIVIQFYINLLDKRAILNAVFLLKAKHGSGYTPPPATGTIFADVPANAFAAAWIEQLVNEGISSGCGGGIFCLNNSATRAQMAVFLVNTFNLP